jgi:hypothetical protein
MIRILKNKYRNIFSKSLNMIMLGVVLISCNQIKMAKNDIYKVKISDPDATPETKALFLNLRYLSPDYLLFGHQD